VTRFHPAPGGPGASEVRRDPPRRDDLPRRPEEHEPSPCYIFDDFDRLDTDSVQRCLSQVRSTSSASTPSVPQGADSGTTPRRLQSLIIQGGGAPDVHVPLPAGGGQGPASDVAEVGRTAPESVERSVVLELAEHREPASESVGAKRAAPENGSPGRPVMRTRVRSKM
jgi:hypothetical protein